MSAIVLAAVAGGGWTPVLSERGAPHRCATLLLAGAPPPRYAVAIASQHMLNVTDPRGLPNLLQCDIPSTEFLTKLCM